MNEHETHFDIATMNNFKFFATWKYKVKLSAETANGGVL